MVEQQSEGRASASKPPHRRQWTPPLSSTNGTEPLDVRRAVALGDLARRQEGLEVSREVVVHVHTTQGAFEASTAGDLTRVARVETRGRKLLTLEQVRLWCGGAAKITIKPVIDCATSIRLEAYESPTASAAQAEECDVTCCFPWCQRPAARCYSDHVVPFSNVGPTETSNIAKLCGSHHRLKTHNGWTHHFLEPSTFLWRSPRGLTLHRGPDGSSRV